MKKLIRIFAIVLSIALLSTAFVGCHEKDEIAYTIGEHKFTSAMYSCVLYVSASTARSAIRTYAEENDEDTKNIKYENYKFNDEGKVSATGTVKYKDFVKNEAIKVLKQYAVILDKMQKNNITIDDELVEEAKAQAYYYWYAGCDYSTYQYYSSYGADVSSYFTPYYEYFEPNGVAYSTYEQYMIYECYYNNYFLYLYDEGGEKEIPRDDLVESLTTHYALGDQFSISYLGNDNKAVSDDEKAKLKAEAQGYVNRLNAGESFDKIYEEYNKESIESSNTSSSTSSTTTSSESTSSTASSETASNTTSSQTSSSDEEEYSPKTYTTVFGDEDTNYSNTHFKTVHELEKGKATLIEDTTNSAFLIVFRRDILEENDYWLNTFRETICFDLKGDEFVDFLNDAGKSLTATEDKHATAPFGVDDIKF